MASVLMGRAVVIRLPASGSRPSTPLGAALSRSKGRLPAAAAACALAALLSSAVQAQPLPPSLTATVNDFADVIDADATRRINEIAARLQAASGDRIVV